MVCFPVEGDDKENSDSLKNFCEESSHFCNRLFLVGTKTDTRAGKEGAFQFKQGLELAKKLNGQAYLECSALNYDGSVEEVFKEVAKRTFAYKYLLESVR